MNVLITGTGARVGRALALEFARKGFSIALHYNQNREGALETLEHVQQIYKCLGDHLFNSKDSSSSTVRPSAFCLQADLSTSQGCSELIQTLKEHWTTLDVLINNASLFNPVAFEEIQLEQWNEMLQVNLTSPFLLAQGCLPLLKQSSLSHGGVVIHLCDIGAERPLSGYTHYSVSKAGLVMLVKSMAIELAPEIRTLGISPGQVAWPKGATQSFKDHLTQRIPLKRSGNPEDIATLARFLVEEGHYLNGEIIAVDGGLKCRY